MSQHQLDISIREFNYYQSMDTPQLTNLEEWWCIILMITSHHASSQNLVVCGITMAYPLASRRQHHQHVKQKVTWCGRDFNLLVVRRSGYHIARGYVSKNKGMRGVKEIELAPWCAGN